MFLLSNLMLLALLGAPELSVTEDPRFPIDEMRGAERWLERTAAAGEYEIIDLRLKNDGQARQLLGCEVSWPDEVEIEGTLYRSAEARDYLQGAAPVGDAYAPLDVIALGPQAEIALLLVVYIPPETDAGDYRAEIKAEFDIGRTADCAFQFRVYDFSLRDQPALASLFDLDLGRAYSGKLATADLDAWTPLYDNMAEFGVAYRFTLGEDSTENTALLEERRAHLNYIAATTRLPVVDIGGKPGMLAASFPPATVGEPQDALQNYVHSVMIGLDNVGTGAHAMVTPATIGGRKTWHEARQYFARYRRADKRVSRLLVAPPHPHFERYTDVWALPESVPSGVLQLLATGRSLVRYDQQLISMGIGARGGLDRTGLYETLPSEVVDGSEATSWTPEPSMLGGEAPGLEITFQERTRLEAITLLVSDATAIEVPLVETAYRPGEYTRATVDWEGASGVSELGHGIFSGTFRFPRDCYSIRLKFTSAQESRFSIAELLFNNEGLKTQELPIEAVIPWLDASSAAHVAWKYSAHDVSDGARSLGWRSWGLGFLGIFGPELTGAPSAGSALVGLGANSLLPTRRLLSFRDGLEDYGYLAQFWEGVRKKEIKAPPDFAPGMGAEIYDDSIAAYKERRRMRDVMGRLLSGEGYVTKNFGP